MAFADQLRSAVPSDKERIDATCKHYTKSILAKIHDFAYSAARNQQNRIEGYLATFDTVHVTPDRLGYISSYDNDPINYNVVFYDINCSGYYANDNLRLDKNTFDRKVIENVKKQLKNDGFTKYIVRCDSAPEYSSSRLTGVLKKREVKEYTGKTGLYVYIDISW